MSVFQYLQIEHGPSDQVIDLLEKNVIGTPGQSMLYRHQDLGAKISNISNPVFANLSIRERLYGTICLSKREVFNFGKRKDAYYLRYFTFREQLRSTNPKDSKKGRSKIRQEVSDLMDGKGLDYDNELLLYAYVDNENFRSKRITDEFGFRKSGAFNVIPFSRINPKIDKKVNRIDITEQPIVRQMLQESYCEQQLVSFDQLFSGGDYFAIKDNDREIICGVQAIVDGWNIIDLPGMSGKLMMYVVPKLPILGKLFNPDFQFVFLEYLYCKPGYERNVEMLLESVLGILKMNSAVICLDPSSKLYAQMKNINFGLTQKIMGESGIDIVVKCTDKSFFSNEAAFFVSGFDVL